MDDRASVTQHVGVVMRRFHVHLAVEDLEQNVRFYSNMFGAPAVQQADYAKWMIADPPVNFAISTRGHAMGLNHLGIQTDSDDDLRTMQQQMRAAEVGMVTEQGAECCYAASNKYWMTDPQGIAWETFHTLGAIPMFGTSHWDREDDRQAPCCVPSATSQPSCASNNVTECQATPESGRCCATVETSVAR